MEEAMIAAASTPTWAYRYHEASTERGDLYLIERLDRIVLWVEDADGNIYGLVANVIPEDAEKAKDDSKTTYYTSDPSRDMEDARRYVLSKYGENVKIVRK